MTIALWIIAVVETIRMVEQSVQLWLIAKDTGARDNVYDELIKSFKESDREYVRNLLEAFDNQGEPQTDYDKGLQQLREIMFDKEKTEQLLKECEAMGIKTDCAWR